MTDRGKTSYTIEPIAHIHTAFEEKFGLPRQGSLVPGLTGVIRFVPKYRDPDSLTGLSGFSHVWLIWSFSENADIVEKEGFTPMTRPPRLGGNAKIGIFASRSPFRPNSLGLSAVKIDSIDLEAKDGPLIYVSGVDMLDGTPIFDIKPYVPYADSIPDALGGFAQANVREREEPLIVTWMPGTKEKVPEEERENVRRLLALDPRPAYHADPERIYGMEYAGMDVRFRVKDNTLYVTEVVFR